MVPAESARACARHRTAQDGETSNDLTSRRRNASVLTGAHPWQRLDHVGLSNAATTSVGHAMVVFTPVLRLAYWWRRSPDVRFVFSFSLFWRL